MTVLVIQSSPITKFLLLACKYICESKLISGYLRSSSPTRLLQAFVPYDRREPISSLKLVNIP